MTMPLNKAFSSLCAIGFSLFSALTLSVESYLNLQGSSFCKTASCEVVGNYLTLPESFLVASGAIFFWCLTLLLFFAGRYPKHLGNLPLFFFIPALAFDGTLIGFQYFTIQEKCSLCLAVAAALLLVSVSYCAARSSFTLLLCCLLAWGGGFAANSIIKMPEPGKAHSRMILHETRTASVEDSQVTSYTLIFSMECAHCLDVVEYLADQTLPPAIWALAAIDQDQPSVNKLAAFHKQAANAANPFVALQAIKQDDASEYPFFTGTIRKNNGAARSFLSNIGINNIPVLLIESPDREKRLLIGSEKIINYFDDLFTGTLQAPHDNN